MIVIPEYYKDDFILIFDLGSRKYIRHFETFTNAISYLGSDKAPKAPFQLRHVVSTLLLWRRSVEGLNGGESSE